MMKFVPIFSIYFLISCASLHYIQIGEIYQSSRFRKRPIKIKVSELGVSTTRTTEAVKQMASARRKENPQAGSLVSLLQLGPATGNLVFEESYARDIIRLLHQDCPSGRITSLSVIRESRSYSDISGEIIKITGYCLEKRKR